MKKLTTLHRNNWVRIKTKTMGDISDSIIEGETCSFCGIMFEEPHGHPVACENCWDKDCGVPKATNEEI